MIKVCHIVNLITGKSDGVYSHLKIIFRNSDNTKFQHYLIFQGGENIEKEIIDLGIKVFVIPSLKKKVSLQSFIEVYKILKRNEIDIIHTHLIKPYAITGLVNIILRKKFIFNYHGIFLKNNPYYNFIEKIIYSIIHSIIFLAGKVDAVLVPSNRSKELLRNETKLFPKPLVYYNGYSSNQRSSEPNIELLKKIQEIKKDKFIIAIIGRLEIDKRIDRAIDLVKKLIILKKNVHLLIFGEGSLKNELQYLVKKLELENYINFVGYVKEIQNYYKLFDIVLFTSDWEGMPLTMWEALGNKVPIIAPDVGGFKEILEQNNCGVIYEAGNLVKAEEKIVNMIDDVQLRKKIGENGRMAVETNYNVEKFIRQIEQVYLALLPE